MAFVKAETGGVYVKAVLTGAPGCGKTLTALTLASWLAARGDRSLAWQDTTTGRIRSSPLLAGRVALIDSEGRGREYARYLGYSLEELPAFGAEEWTNALSDAARSGFSAVVLDSLSDEWGGAGGVLEVADKLKAAGNAFQAWGTAKAPHRKLIDRLLQFPGHVLCTVRSKLHYEMQGEGREKKVVCAGLDPIQENEFPFRLSFVFDLSQGDAQRGPVLTVGKSVCPELLQGSTHERPGVAFCETLAQWAGVPSEAGSAGVFDTYRERFSEAGGGGELAAAGRDLKGEGDVLTRRERARLGEIYKAREKEFAPVAPAASPPGEAPALSAVSGGK